LWLARLTAELEINANSLERVQEYTELEQENTEGLVPPEQWPSDTGRIEVKDLTVRYGADHAPVLKAVTFTIDPQTKVAIVGR
jgi:ABC-type multidrug transport system fused ATPase/permease subunit